MFLLRRPSTGFIDEFLRRAHDHELSYVNIGITRHNRKPVDEVLAIIGRGSRDFTAARRALTDWKQFDIGWVTLFPATASIDVGTNVAVLIAHLGFWSLNGCRVVYHAERSHTRFGYAYATLPTHAECGEELFEVYLDEGTDDVIYRIRAASTAQALLATIGHPYVRCLQERFRRDSADAMRRAVTSYSPFS